MDYKKLKALATFTESIGGVEFTLARRTNMVMLEIGGVQQVLSLLAKGTTNVSDPLKDVTAFVDAQGKTLKLIVKAVDGVQIDEGFDWEALDPFADALFISFLNSGLDVDPLPGSLKGGKGPS